MIAKTPTEPGYYWGLRFIEKFFEEPAHYEWCMVRVYRGLELEGQYDSQEERDECNPIRYLEADIDYEAKDYLGWSERLEEPPMVILEERGKHDKITLE